ncbi:S8 family serine peptidase [Halorubellus litoreus]|uniref:S8 family serine peptidase n=1 Tax=Halorubellus litoreus TaxID=755308 RepID=A0ABD5VL02_9EURY
MSRRTPTRRSVLAGIGAAGIGSIGTAAGSTGKPERHVVGTANRKATRAAERAADDVHRTLDFGDIGRAVAGRFSEAALRNLRRNPNVRYVEPDGRMHAIAQTTPWGVDRVDADLVHADGKTGGDDTDGDGGADVAIIDTGIDDDHPDLQANVGSGKAYVSCSGSGCNYAWSDDNDHGTHCAGIAGADDNTEGVVGVSTGATLHAVKVLDSQGSGTFSDVAAGIEYTANQGWDVASLSLGASSGSSTVKDACQYAYDNGVLLVAAAGNSGPCSDCVGYPAAYSTVVAVSSTDSDDSLSSFSSTGPEVELAAPGGSIYSTVVGGDYATFSGTSMACPHVSGAGAQLMDNGYTNTEARDQLTATAEDLGLDSNDQGSGLLDVDAAVDSSTDSAPSVSWVTPGDGDTVSGTVGVQIDATDSEDGDDTLDVTYAVDDGSARSTTYTSAGYYEDDWDSTTVADGEHALEASATDSAGNTTTSTITVTTDNAESAPTVDSLSATEVETSDGDAEFDASWDVSDADGDLDAVDLTLTSDADGTTEDTASVAVSGDAASETTRLVAADDDGSGESYTVDLVVTDAAGASDSGSTTVNETESTNAAPTPTIDRVVDNSNPAWDRFDVSWSTTDADGNLDTVTVELRDNGGSVLDAASNDVSGGSASGTNGVRTKRTAGTVAVVATDTEGATETVTQNV